VHQFQIGIRDRAGLMANVEALTARAAELEAKLNEPT